MIHNIKDRETRDALMALERKLDKIYNIPQASSDTTLEQLINIVNRIISRDKRR